MIKEHYAVYEDGKGIAVSDRMVLENPRQYITQITQTEAERIRKAGIREAIPNIDLVRFGDIVLETLVSV